MRNRFLKAPSLTGKGLVRVVIAGLDRYTPPHRVITAFKFSLRFSPQVDRVTLKDIFLFLDPDPLTHPFILIQSGSIRFFGRRKLPVQPSINCAKNLNSRTTKQRSYAHCPVLYVSRQSFTQTNILYKSEYNHRYTRSSLTKYNFFDGMDQPHLLKMIW